MNAFASPLFWVCLLHSRAESIHQDINTFTRNSGIVLGKMKIERTKVNKHTHTPQKKGLAKKEGTAEESISCMLSNKSIG